MPIKDRGFEEISQIVLKIEFVIVRNKLSLYASQWFLRTCLHGGGNPNLVR